MVRKEQYRLGIVGLGRMASTIDDEVRGYSSVTLPYSVAAGARAIPRLRLAAGCDIRADKREAFSARWGVTELYEDYERMLREADLDLVAICTRGPLHAPMTLAAVAAGVPMVFCEKAMACSLAEADAVRAAIRAEGTRFNTGVLRRFDTRYHQARQLIREGAIGEPRAALHFAPSTLLHGHIHSMDTLSFLLDDPEILAVRGELLPRDLVAAAGRWEHDPRATYALEFAGGVEAISVAAGNWEFQVLGTEGVIGSQNNGSGWFLRRKQPVGARFSELVPAEYPAVSPRSSTVACLEDLLDASEQDRPTLGHIEVTHRVTEACFAVVESHRRGGARVPLPLADRETYVFHV